MICLKPRTGKRLSKKIWETVTLATVSKEVLEAQTTTEDCEVYRPFFVLPCRRESHCIGNVGNKSTATLATPPKKGKFYR